MRTVTAKELLPSPRRGGASRSQLIRADDKQIYNVKFQQSDQGWRTLVNELVGSQLARDIGVPVPESVTVIIDELFFRQILIFKSFMIRQLNRAVNLGVGILSDATHRPILQ
jgi:hypothetical protein